MNELLKQRLVGALILVALGVIFWPIIFVEPAGEAPARQGMPPQPRVSTEPVEAPDRVGLRDSRPLAVDREREDAQAQPVDEVVLAQDGPRTGSTPDEPAAPAPAEPAPETGPRTEAPEALELDADGVPLAWILQVATVSSAQNAEALRDELIAMEYKAYVEEVSSNGKRLYRVYAGPKFERARVESMQAAVDARFGVRSLVRRYRP